MTDPDAEAFEYYDEPAHRKPVAGAPQRRPDRTLTEHVPVRFPAATIEAVRELAETDGMTLGKMDSAGGRVGNAEPKTHARRGAVQLAGTRSR